MDYYSNQITQLIEELGKLPGIGPKSAGRLAFHIINMPQDQVQKLSDTIISAKTNVHYCKECCTLTDNEICPICASDKRDHSTIMVVENTRDLMAYEKTGKYEGVYHVLHGAISPMLGIGPDDIRLKELMARLQGDVKEIGVPYVLAKADGTLKGEILKRVGADEIVYPEEEMGARIANNLLGGSMTDLFDLSADTSIVKVPARKEWINKSLVDINFRGKYNVNVIAIEGEGGVDGAPDPTKPIKDEENLVLIGKKEDLVKLRK